MAKPIFELLVTRSSAMKYFQNKIFASTFYIEIISGRAEWIFFKIL